MKTEHDDEPEDSEAIPFDDCLRLLVNTPPQPKKGKDKAPPDEGGGEEPEK